MTFIDYCSKQQGSIWNPSRTFFNYLAFSRACTDFPDGLHVAQKAMNEVCGSIHQEKEMPVAICNGRTAERSLLPMKRKSCEYHRGDEVIESPHTKQFVSEELMSKHLQQLKLSPAGHSVSATSLPLQLNIKTVASCPQSSECHIGRKRSSEDRMDEDYSMDLCQDINFKNQEQKTTSRWTQPSKKLKLDTGSVLPMRSLLEFKNEIETRRLLRSKVGHDEGCHVKPNLTHSIGNYPDLSSIPEEHELNQEPVNYPDNKVEPEISEPGFPKPDFLNATSKGSKSLNGLPCPLLNLPLSPATPDCPQNLNDKPHSVWIAPELKSITDNPIPLLPSSIMKELKSKGMEIVPWVKPEAIIKGSTSVPVVISSCPENVQDDITNNCHSCSNCDCQSCESSLMEFN